MSPVRLEHKEHSMSVGVGFHMSREPELKAELEVTRILPEDGGEPYMQVRLLVGYDTITLYMNRTQYQEFRASACNLPTTATAQTFDVATKTVTEAKSSVEPVGA